MNLESCLSCFGCLLTSFLYWVCRYTIIKEVGDGTFGSVWRAIHKESGEVVYHSASPFFLLFLFFFSSHTVWLPVPLPSHLIDTPVLIGCDQENEEKILFLGRVHKPPWSEGGCCFMTCLISIMCSVAFSWVTYYLLNRYQSLRRMNHPNIVKLKEVIRENDMLFFVFEYMVWSIHNPCLCVVSVLVVCEVTVVWVFCSLWWC